jgi:hydrogenase nickel incorporation protein HypB
MVERALEGWDVGALDFLFVENVGNLVCPSSYDLGENLRMVLLSVTEGEDKPLKYPTIMRTSDIAVLTKMDLAAAVEFDCETMRRNIGEMPVFETSAKTGAGVRELAEFILSRR